MKAFISTSLRNTNEAFRIINILKNLSIEYQCCITDQGNLEGEELFNYNVKGIKGSDIFISVLKDIGKDVSTEIGIAYSLGKKSIGIVYDISPTDVMPYFASGMLVKEIDLPDVLKSYMVKDAAMQFYNFNQHNFNEAIYDFNIILDSKFFVDNKYLQKLENKLADRYHRNVIVTNSGTSALILALDTLLKEKKEVIVPSLTFSATIQSILHAGGIPIFADVDKTTWTLDPQCALKRISNKTGAIIPVNLFGVPSDIESFKSISKYQKIPIIYDSCQAFGATTSYGEIGTFGEMEVFSLDATKVLSGGLGGFITMQNPSLYLRLKLAKNFGNNDERETVQIGINGRMSEFNSALALKSLETVDNRLLMIGELVIKYKEILSNIPGVIFQQEKFGKSAPCQFSILINSNIPGIQYKIKDYLNKNGIEIKIFNPTLLHKLKFVHNTDYKLPNTESMHSKILCLPMHKNVGIKQQYIIAETLRRFLK